MRVKAEAVDFGRLAGGLLARAKAGLTTDVEALGAQSINNAVKALALANELGKREAVSDIGVAFCPTMTHSEKGAVLEGMDRMSKGIHFAVSAAPAGSSPHEDRDFSKGGIYVPFSLQSRARGEASKESDATKDGTKDADEATARLAGSDGAGTPTELAKAVLGHWLRFAAPETRAAARAAAAARSGGNPARFGGKRSTPPFLVGMGPSAISRAIKALSFAHGDLAKEERFAGVPPFVVVPRFWISRKKDKYNGQEKATKLMALCLAHAEDPKHSRSTED